MTDLQHQDLAVEHDVEAQRYVLRRGGDQVGYLAYDLDGDVVDLASTQIFPAARGRGLGAVLVRHALDDARAQGHTVIPSCWYVADFLRDHDDYADLRAAGA